MGKAPRHTIFIDTEVNPDRRQIGDCGGVRWDGGEIHTKSVDEFVDFLSGAEYLCGHNILRHDLIYLSPLLKQAGSIMPEVIDTLFLSPLLFPTKPYHHLVKDDKLQTDDLNNPLNDAKQARVLLYEEVDKFRQMDEPLKRILCSLLFDKEEFSGFFQYVGCPPDEFPELVRLIRDRFQDKICSRVKLETFIEEYPVELGYCLVLIDSSSRYSITPPWVLKQFPEVETLMYRLRNTPCVEGCSYCEEALNIYTGLKRFFGYDSFRSYAGKPLQAQAAQAAIEGRSLLAVFPTGGGKSITFQLPALMGGEAAKGLTVVISPLQSLMKDQVDNLLKNNITEAVTINGQLDPIERGKAYEKVADGSASLLYISPESLRSRSIEYLLLGRKIIRFVIDEAHCFSAWGQDFRVDYLYIGDFIRTLQTKKNLTEPIPVSCFTATAKQNVIEDITQYFKDKLGLTLELFRSAAARTNLTYKVLRQEDEGKKYETLRGLINSYSCPAIVYVSRTQRANDLASALRKDNIQALSYHGKMDLTRKKENQEKFMSGEIKVIVATSAFGMGVDKKDVGLVIHYDISDSLENYVQEAGRAGRDEHIHGDCYILFNEDDLNKNFILLNQTRLHQKEIQQIWKAVKEVTAFRTSVSQSALEIARAAGWDDSVHDIETRVKTAIAALEEAGYLKREQNEPCIFANSILEKTAQDAIDKINASARFDEKQRVVAIRIIKKLFSTKSRKQATDEVPEARIDYISDHLGIVKEKVIEVITLLREEKILADAKDITAFIKAGESVNRSLEIVKLYNKLDNFLLSVFSEEEQTFHLKELLEQAGEKTGHALTPDKLKTIINFWAVKNHLHRQYKGDSKYYITAVCTQPYDVLQRQLEHRHELAVFIVEYLFKKVKEEGSETTKGEVFVEFSVLELNNAYLQSTRLLKVESTLADIEDTLFYLSRIGAIKIEGGFLVVYNRLRIKRLENNNRKQYTQLDYHKLDQFYNHKVQQIHIVGEYAQKMLEDYKEALQFTEDYFQLNYFSFLSKYFKGSRQDEIKQKVTPAKFRKLFGDLSPTQLSIIRDKESQYIVVLAGPGSGKTRVLVHKLASLLLMEDIKHEQLLMLTFSRAAAGEFRKRLYDLIGNAVGYIDIKTFHSYCFDLLGRMGSLERSSNIIEDTVLKIQNGEVEPNRITKTVLVIDEAQDMTAAEFSLVEALMQKNEEMRIIAVGDDDQNIYTFRGADSGHLQTFITQHRASQYDLLSNYRSKQNLVHFANQFVVSMSGRLKDKPIIAHQNEDGEIHITKYTSFNFEEPFARIIASVPLTGTTCVLTRTNEEAMLVATLLKSKGCRAKLIQENKDLRIYNLQEIQFFITCLKFTPDTWLIDNSRWSEAKRSVKARFQGSSTWEIIRNIILKFEEIYPGKRYRSDWMDYLYEARLEEFYDNETDRILVSTIHKAKGKEFDNLFILLNSVQSLSNEFKRGLYVAFTRAKTRLEIHLNGNYLDAIQTTHLYKRTDTNSYGPPAEFIIYLTHEDVFLSFQGYRQSQIDALKGGDLLQITENGCADLFGKEIIRYSNSFKRRLGDYHLKGYTPRLAKVNFVVYWEDKKESKIIKVVLPKVVLRKEG